MFRKLQREYKYIFIPGDFNVHTLPHVRGALSAQEIHNDVVSNNQKKDELLMLVQNIYYFFPILANECYSGILERSILDQYEIFSIGNIVAI